MMPKKILLGSVVGFLLVLAVLVAMLVRGGSSTDGVTDEVAQDEVTQDVAVRPDCPEAGIDLPCLGGETAPNDKAQDYTVVSLWAWWCEPCRAELPLFDELAAKHPEYNVVGVHADKSAANGAAMLDDLGVDMPSFQDDGNEFAGRLGLPGVVPITVVLDARGEMLGFVPKPFTDFDDVEREVARVIQEAA